MATTTSTALSVNRREASGSRAARRLRRGGDVPGVVYGGGQAPAHFQVDARELRHALSHAGAVLNLSLDGGASTPVVIKELVRHPVSGAIVHVDLLRVRLDQPIQASVIVELVGTEDAPGVRQGGVLEQITREVSVEALPGDIPDSLPHDVSGLGIGENVTLEQVSPPAGITLVDDPETVIVTITPPRLQAESEVEIEAETELVAAGATAAEAGEAAGEESGADESSGE